MSSIECLARLGNVVGPGHQVFRRQLSGVLEEPHEIAFRDQSVPKRGPDHRHHRRRRLGPGSGFAEEEVLGNEPYGAPAEDVGVGCLGGRRLDVGLVPPPRRRA